MLTAEAVSHNALINSVDSTCDTSLADTIKTLILTMEKLDKHTEKSLPINDVFPLHVLNLEDIKVTNRKYSINS